MKIVIFQSSNTQRVAINTVPGESSILLSKEWKKDSNDSEWILGKSIEIPFDKLKMLMETFQLIECNQELLFEGKKDLMFEQSLSSNGCEVVQDE